MTSRGLFAIKLALLPFLMWQLGISGCAWARWHGNSSSTSNPSTTNTTSNTSNGDPEAAEITQLEQKLFQRDYSADPSSQRLDRLEKMVFGKTSSSSESQRVASLKAATITSALEKQPTVSNQESPTISPSDNAAPRSANNGRKHAANTTNTGNTGTETNDDKTANSGGSGDLSQYPAVTAIERRLFGKDYSADPIDHRLNRLELKEFGKVSDSDDLSERVDQLKQATGIDIAKQRPSGSDWVDEDELTTTDAPGVGKITPFTPDAVEDGTNINSFIGGSGHGQGYSQGLGGGGGGYMPHVTPITAEPRLGLNQEVSALEKEVFGKTYLKDALPARISRLEAAIFPQEKPSVDKSLPDRVSRLLAAVPLTDEDAQQEANASNQTQSAKHGLKLSKLLGNMMGFTGAYPGAGTGNLTVDPQTGLLYNGSTGQLIDPSTGAVIGQRSGGNTMGGAGMSGMSPWGFGSGMSPFGTMPYGYGGGMGGGMGFGMGRMGMGGYGGMWP